MLTRDEIDSVLFTMDGRILLGSKKAAASIFEYKKIGDKFEKLKRHYVKRNNITGIRSLSFLKENPHNQGQIFCIVDA